MYVHNIILMLATFDQSKDSLGEAYVQHCSS